MVWSLNPVNTVCGFTVSFHHPNVACATAALLRPQQGRQEVEDGGGEGRGAQRSDQLPSGTREWPGGGESSACGSQVNPLQAACS